MEPKISDDNAATRLKSKYKLAKRGKRPKALPGTNNMLLSRIISV